MAIGGEQRLFILPKVSSRGANIYTLAHPRTAVPSRYLFDPHLGLHEFTRIIAPRSACRSWLVETSLREESEVISRDKEDLMSPSVEVRRASLNGMQSSSPPSSGMSARKTELYMKSSPELLIATPIDPMFLTLPALVHVNTSQHSTKKLFLSVDDLLETLFEKSRHMESILGDQAMHKRFESRIAAVSDIVDAGDERMYRLSESKLLACLISKASHMVRQGLPASLEERFVQGILKTPIASIKREGSSISDVPIQDETRSTDSASAEPLSPLTAPSSLESSIKSDDHILVPDDILTPAEDELHRLLRLRTAMLYMISSYLPPILGSTIETLMASESCSINFKPLDRRLAEIERERIEAINARSIGDFSRKRNTYEDDETVAIRSEKRKKKEEEDKKKKSEPRGIRDLKKVDTKGMKKMGDFFTKSAAPKN